MNHNDDWSDKNIRAAFLKMVFTIGLLVPWLMVTIFLGILKDWAFFDNAHIQNWQHIVFFAWFAGTLPVIIWIMKVKIWKI